MLEDWKRRRAVNRVRSGDGRPLTPFRWWQLVTGRKLFYLYRAGRDGAEADYAIDVYSSGKRADQNGYGKAHLFRDGRHYEEARLPAVFPIEGGHIEVAETLSGLKRAHYVTAGGDETLLTPDPRSAIGRRLGFDREHPTASRSIGAVSVVLLIAGLGLNGLQLLEPILGIPPIVAQFGRFESPIHLPLWLNVALGVAAGLASTERALRLRYHWLLDAAGT